MASKPTSATTPLAATRSLRPGTGRNGKGRNGSGRNGRNGRPRGVKGWLNASRRLWFQALEMPALWTLLAVAVLAPLLMPQGLLFTPRVEAGAVAQRDFVAPKDLEILDSRATAEKRQRAREEVLAVYDFDPRLRQELDLQFTELFDLGRREEPAPIPEELRAATDLRLGSPQMDLLVGQGFSADLEDRIRSLVGQAHRRKIVSNKARLLDHSVDGIVLRDIAAGTEQVERNLFVSLGYPDELREFLEAQVRNWPGLSGAERRVLGKLLLENLAPNLQRNRLETQRRQGAAEEEVEPLFTRVRRGQVIVRRGDAVSPPQAEAIASLSGSKSMVDRMLPVTGTVFLVALAVLLLWLGLRRERVAGHSRERVFNEVLLTLVLSLLGAKFAFVVAKALGSTIERAPFDSAESYIFAIPFAAASLIAGLLFGRPIALLSAVVFSVLVSRLALGEPIAVVVYSLAGSFAAIFGLEQIQIKQRLVMIRIGLLVSAVSVVTVLLLHALSDSPVTAGELAFRAACAVGGGMIVTAVASFAIPILESMLGITTDIKLIELSNTNLPILRRLAFEAPGTFQHSLMVANLAKVGCEAVRADATLAYTGGLYHDIGKVLRPEYFVENQRPGHNRHDKLSPSMSALILINHVKEGVELAREQHLPQAIIDAIEQHHGTRLIKFFYNRAVERCDPETGEVNEAKYRYPGPKPQDKVMGVLMLADAVEAASRTLIDPSPAKVRSLIRTLTDDALADGQLDHTDLTLADLHLVTEAFQRVLTNIFHRRVDYPGFDFNAPPKQERRASEARAS